MKTLKFIHCADLHIDSPFKGIANINPEVAQLLRQSTFQSFNKIIDVALSEQVDFVLIAGDIYDCENKSLRAQLKFRDGLSRLTKQGIQSFIVYGNHDPINGWKATLQWPDGVHFFPGDKVECKHFEKNGEVVANIYGISFIKRDVTDNLALKFPQAEKNVPCIGLLHANVGGRKEYEPYSPCTIEHLSSKGMDYWALGHVHTHEIIKAANPAIVYPGCSQSRNARETGQKGCCLVTQTSGRDTEIKFITTDVIRYAQDSLDISDCSTPDDVITSSTGKCREISVAMDRCLSLIRLSLTGRTELHTELQKGNGIEGISEQIREQLAEEKPIIWLEKLILHTAETYDLDSLRQGKDFIADVISICDESGKIDSLRGEALRDNLSPLFAKWIGYKYLKELPPEELDTLIKEARDEILTQLVRTE
jgi:exonuclease SbcD